MSLCPREAESQEGWNCHRAGAHLGPLLFPIGGDPGPLPWGVGWPGAMGGSLVRGQALAGRPWTSCPGSHVPCAQAAECTVQARVRWVSNGWGWTGARRRGEVTGDLPFPRRVFPAIGSPRPWLRKALLLLWDQAGRCPLCGCLPRCGWVRGHLPGGRPGPSRGCVWNGLWRAGLSRVGPWVRLCKGQR